eukprot:TRINITY_DN9320_c0_g2_i1.p1 TRINITY_DN9320_c0_g2~~TRINITY_DN9320_c0_g2_i1.p1  ORF type:complete len:653 (+),score=73.94 TRINITY_DN9320_c0_g2_i1:55-1959(+)
MDTGRSSAIIWLHALRAMVALIVLVYVWSCRGDIRHWVAYPWMYCKKLLLASFHPEVDALAKHVEEEFLQLRLARFTTFVKQIMPIATCYMVVIIVQSTFVDTLDALWNVAAVVIAMFPIYTLGILVVRGASSRWCRDAVMAYIYATLSARVLLYRVGYESFRYASASSFRVVIQTFLTLMYLDCKKSSWANLCLCIVEVVAYAYGEIDGMEALQETTGQFAAREFIVFAMIMLTAFAVEDAGRLLVRRSIEVRTSNSTERAVESILDVLCDAVVHLGSDLRLLKDCQQLGHLLLMGVGAKRAVRAASARCDFLQHLVEEDLSRFQEFLARRSEKVNKCLRHDEDGAAASAVGPNAIHVSLRDKAGSTFRVQVIHANLTSCEGNGHILGIRDLGDSARMYATGASEPQALPEMSEAAAAGSQASSSAGSDSSSGASLGSRSLRHSDLEPYAMTLTVDVFDKRFAVHDVALTIQDPSTTAAAPSLLPLSLLLSRDSYSMVSEWLTCTVNDIAYGRAARPIGDVVFAYGEDAIMRAGRAEVRIENTVGADLMTQESCLVSLRFERLTVPVQNSLGKVRKSRKAKSTLPRILETQSVSWGIDSSRLAKAGEEPERTQAHHRDSVTDAAQSSQPSISL